MVQDGCHLVNARSSGEPECPTGSFQDFSPACLKDRTILLARREKLRAPVIRDCGGVAVVREDYVSRGCATPSCRASVGLGPGIAPAPCGKGAKLRGSPDGACHPRP